MKYYIVFKWGRYNSDKDKRIVAVTTDKEKAEYILGLDRSNENGEIEVFDEPEVTMNRWVVDFTQSGEVYRVEQTKNKHDKIWSSRGQVEVILYATSKEEAIEEAKKKRRAYILKEFGLDKEV